MPTTYAEYVVCGIHDILFPASARCPDCPESPGPGCHTSPSHHVKIVQSRGGGQ
jgi:hypothetical protein